MDNSNKIVPPHLNAEIYRTDTTGTDTFSYLDYIRMHADGSVLVGSSELTGRYWNGGATVLKSIAEEQHGKGNLKRSVSLTSGTADGCFVNCSNKILLGEDNGSVSLWSKDDGEVQNAWSLWRQEVLVTEHDDAVLAVDCLAPGQQYVTAGGDGNVKVWDVEDMICVRNYSAAHSMLIYAVTVRPLSTNSFATGSMDQYVTLWDENIHRPALDLLKNDCGIRCLQWMDEHWIVIGDEAGVLSLVDVRNPETAVKITEFPAAVHKLAVQQQYNKVAVCCDNKIVSVCDINDNSTGKVIYHDRHMHSNYVRGVAWDVRDDKTLHTLGWDGEIKSHNIVWD